MDLGWLDVCLRVANVRESRRFYEGLGFRRVEGDDVDGWAVVVNGEARLGLFEPRFMADSAFTLNFRGSNLATLTEDLAARGYRFEPGTVVRDDGSGSARLTDPDGHRLFFDSAPGETKRT